MKCGGLGEDMSSNIFDGIDDEFRKDGGCTTEMEYIEQSSWILFLKYLDVMEKDRQANAVFEGRTYTPILDEAYRWEAWAAPQKDGRLDYANALTGDDLLDFVNKDLFPYLASFGQRADGPDTIEYKIGEIFSEVRNRCQGGATLRAVLNLADEFKLGTQEHMHEMSSLYEDKINRMGNAGRNGGEYYTPRPLIRAMIQVVDPKIGETVYDGAVGSAGFLCEANEYMTKQAKRAEDINILQKSTFFGKEKKGLAYVIGIMNLILHGIDAPNIIHTNTLNENVMDIQEKDRHNIVLANPPFGAKERAEVQQNFPIQTSETAYLFLQHFIRMLKVGGRAAIVIKNTFLSNADAASKALRKELLTTCNLHTILDCPAKTFQGAGVKTVVLFFDKGTPTKNIWYYQLDPGRSLGKINPLNEKDLEEFVTLQPSQGECEQSWVFNIDDLDEATYDLSVKNPNIDDEVVLRSPTEILDEIERLDEESREILKKIRDLL